jgi:hypothetical protein
LINVMEEALRSIIRTTFRDHVDTRLESRPEIAKHKAKLAADRKCEQKLIIRTNDENGLG